jgi:hypothetical protein
MSGCVQHATIIAITEIPSRIRVGSCGDILELNCVISLIGTEKISIARLTLNADT